MTSLHLLFRSNFFAMAGAVGVYALLTFPAYIWEVAVDDQRTGMAFMELQDCRRAIKRFAMMQPERMTACLPVGR